MKNKLAITLWNYKGGVGKSTISLILAEIAASKGLHTVAIDLDDQHTLAHTLGLAAPLFQNLQVKFALPAHDEADFVVIDTHQVLDNPTIDALNFADLVLVPVFTAV